MSTQTIPSGGAKPTDASAFQTAFIIAWLFCLLFYFMEYAVRSAPSVMLPELRAAFGLNTAGLSSLIGLYYYSYAGFAIVAGASVDRWGAKYTIPAGVLILAAGTAMFAVNVGWIAGVGRFLQGAGAAFAFVAAVRRRKPVVLAGAALMLLATLAIFYLPPETFPPYVLAFLLGFGSGAAMIPYSIIKEG